MNSVPKHFHSYKIYDIASEYENFVRSAYKFEFTNEHGMSLALMKNLLDAESGLPLSFLGDRMLILEEIRLTMKNAINQYKHRTYHREYINLIELIETKIDSAQRGQDIIDILKFGNELNQLENNSI